MGHQEGHQLCRGVSDCDVLLGDVNLDGVVDLLDVQPFVDLLISGEIQAEADINQDGFVDLLDVRPFVDLSSGCFVQELVRQWRFLDSAKKTTDKRTSVSINGQYDAVPR